MRRALALAGVVGLAALSASGAAQPPGRSAPALPPAPLLVDSASAPSPAPGAARPLRARPVPDSALAALQADGAFRYDRPVAERPSLWDRFKAWVWQNVVAPVLYGSQTPGGRIFWLLLAGLIVAWAVSRLLRVEGGGLFGRRDRPATGTSGGLLDVDDIAAVDLQGALRQAEATGDGRAALRLRFLLALQRLDARGLVAWSKEKTNRDYVREARAAGGDAVAGPLADVTRAFEAVWYGGRPGGIDRYHRLVPTFDRLDAALGARPS